MFALAAEITLETALGVAVERATRTGQPVDIPFSGYLEHPAYIIQPDSDPATVRDEYLATLWELQYGG